MTGAGESAKPEKPKPEKPKPAKAKPGSGSAKPEKAKPAGRPATDGQPPKPRSFTPDQLEAARGLLLDDVLADDLDVLFCGINPGLRSAAAGRHFANPANRFWPALHASGFTPRRFGPDDQDELPALGLGITNIVARTTARADELTRQELVDGGVVLRGKAVAHRPRYLAVLGVTAYRVAFGDRTADIGPQDRVIGLRTKVWVLPNPSGLNAHYTPARLADEFRRLRAAVMFTGP